MALTLAVQRKLPGPSGVKLSENHARNRTARAVPLLKSVPLADAALLAGLMCQRDSTADRASSQSPSDTTPAELVSVESGLCTTNGISRQETRSSAKALNPLRQAQWGLRRSQSCGGSLDPTMVRRKLSIVSFPQAIRKSISRGVRRRSDNTPQPAPLF